MPFENFEKPTASFGETFLQFYKKQKARDYEDKLEALQQKNLAQRLLIEEKSKNKLTVTSVKNAKQKHELFEKRRKLYETYARPPILQPPPAIKPIFRSAAKPSVEHRVAVGPSDAAEPDLAGLPTSCSPVSSCLELLEKSESVELSASETVTLKVFNTKQNFVEFKLKWFSNIDEEDLKMVDSLKPQQGAVAASTSSHSDYVEAALQSIDDSKKTIKEKAYKTYRKKLNLYNKYQHRCGDARLQLDLPQNLVTSPVLHSTVCAPEYPDGAGRVSAAPKPATASSVLKDAAVRFPESVRSSTQSSQSVKVNTLNAIIDRPKNWEALSMNSLCEHRHVICPASSGVYEDFKHLCHQIRSSEERILYWKDS